MEIRRGAWYAKLIRRIQAHHVRFVAELIDSCQAELDRTVFRHDQMSKELGLTGTMTKSETDNTDSVISPMAGGASINTSTWFAAIISMSLFCTGMG